MESEAGALKSDAQETLAILRRIEEQNKQILANKEHSLREEARVLEYEQYLKEHNVPKIMDLLNEIESEKEAQGNDNESESEEWGQEDDEGALKKAKVPARLSSLKLYYKVIDFCIANIDFLDKVRDFYLDSWQFREAYRAAYESFCDSLIDRVHGQKPAEALKIYKGLLRFVEPLEKIEKLQDIVSAIIREDRSRTMMKEWAMLVFTTFEDLSVADLGLAQICCNKIFSLHNPYRYDRTQDEMECRDAIYKMLMHSSISVKDKNDFIFQAARHGWLRKIPLAIDGTERGFKAAWDTMCEWPRDYDFDYVMPPDIDFVSTSYSTPEMGCFNFPTAAVIVNYFADGRPTCEMPIKFHIPFETYSTIGKKFQHYLQGKLEKFCQMFSMDNIIDFAKAFLDGNKNEPEEGIEKVVDDAYNVVREDGVVSRDDILGYFNEIMYFVKYDGKYAIEEAFWDWLRVEREDPPNYVFFYEEIRGHFLSEMREFPIDIQMHFAEQLPSAKLFDVIPKYFSPELARRVILDEDIFFMDRFHSYDMGDWQDSKNEQGILQLFAHAGKHKEFDTSGPNDGKQVREDFVEKVVAKFRDCPAAMKGLSLACPIEAMKYHEVAYHVNYDRSVNEGVIVPLVEAHGLYYDE